MCVCVCVCMCVCVCVLRMCARARALNLYGVVPSPAVTTIDISIAESLCRNGLLLLLLILLLLLLRVFVADDRSYNIDMIINSSCRSAPRN